MTDLYAYSHHTGRPDMDGPHMFVHRGTFWSLTTVPLPLPLPDGVTERTIAEYEAALDAAKADGMRRGWADHRDGVATVPMRPGDHVREFLEDVSYEASRYLRRVAR